MPVEQGNKSHIDTKSESLKEFVGGKQPPAHTPLCLSPPQLSQAAQLVKHAAAPRLERNRFLYERRASVFGFTSDQLKPNDSSFASLPFCIAHTITRQVASVVAAGVYTHRAETRLNYASWLQDNNISLAHISSPEHPTPVRYVVFAGLSLMLSGLRSETGATLRASTIYPLIAFRVLLVSSVLLPLV